MVTILYRPNSEHEREVLEFQRELTRNQVIVQMINVDSKDGSVIARLHDVTRYPGVLVIQSDGRLQQVWMGELPRISEVAYAAHV